MGVIPGALTEIAAIANPLPARAAVVGAIEAALCRLDQRIDAVRICGRRHADAAQDARGKAVARHLLPGGAAVTRAIHPAAGAAALHRPRLAVHLPHASPQHVRIARIHLDVNRAGLLIDEQHALPRLAAVPRAIDTALGIVAEGMAQRRDEHGVRIGRVDHHAADRLTVAQTGKLPGLAAIDRFIDTIAGDDVAADVGFAGADVDHVLVRRRHRNRTDRRRRLVELVPQGRPRIAAILGAPYAAARRTLVKGVGLLNHACDSADPATAERADQAILHARKRRLGGRLRLLRQRDRRQCRKRGAGQQKSEDRTSRHERFSNG